MNLPLIKVPKVAKNHLRTKCNIDKFYICKLKKLKMSDTAIFIIIVLVLVSILMLIAKLAFKKSILFKVGSIILTIIEIVAILAFLIAKNGFSQLFWAIPAGMSLIGIMFYFLHTSLRVPTKLLKDDIINMLASGKLNFEFNPKVVKLNDEFGEMAQALELVRFKLYNSISEIKEVSQHVKLSAEQQNQAALQISDGASEQASTTEEISSTFEEISATNEQNSNNADTTSNISNNTKLSMNEVNQVVKETVNSIQTIVDRINIINDIAFQTNLLSLNASVEAARAGEYGRGFAVVANEVRLLAENSKKAASEIQDLSDKTIKVTLKAGSMVEQLTNDIDKMNGLVREISIATNEQSSSTNQINSAVFELNNLAQQNATLSEEMAANAEGLTEFSTKLTKSVEFFKLT